MGTYQFGITTFLETGFDSDLKIDHQTRIDHAIEEIVEADRVGLSFYGIGEHHRSDFAASAPAIILAAAAVKTKHIHLGSAVTVLSSDDPIRVYQNFATLDLISNGRAEIMAGRGSFTESFPLFGFDLKDYDALFSEKLALLLEIQKHTQVFFKSKFRRPLEGQVVYPRAKQEKLKVSLAVGGSYESVVRAATLGLPLVIAIIGGEPSRFKPLVDLYKKVYQEHQHKEEDMEISVHSHGFIWEDEEELFNQYWKPHHAYFSQLGKERGWRPYTKGDYLHAIEKGALYIGSPERVANKIAKTIHELGINRFLLHTPGAQMPHEMTLENIRLYGEKVVPKVLEKLSQMQK